MGSACREAVEPTDRRHRRQPIASNSVTSMSSRRHAGTAGSFRSSALRRPPGRQRVGHIDVGAAGTQLEDDRSSSPPCPSQPVASATSPSSTVIIRLSRPPTTAMLSRR